MRAPPAQRRNLVPGKGIDRPLCDSVAQPVNSECRGLWGPPGLYPQRTVQPSEISDWRGFLRLCHWGATDPARGFSRGALLSLSEPLGLCGKLAASSRCPCVPRSLDSSLSGTDALAVSVRRPRKTYRPGPLSKPRLPSELRSAGSCARSMVCFPLVCRVVVWFGFKRWGRLSPFFLGPVSWAVPGCLHS